MKYSAPLAVLSLVLALAAPLAASETIKLKSGKAVKGRATAYDGEKKILHFTLDDGQNMAYPLDELDARSLYLVYSSVIPKENGKGQLQLANVARDAGLWEHAARRYGYAEKADPSLKPEIDQERAKGRQMAAAFCMSNASAARAKGDGKESEKWLKLVLERLPNEPQAAEAAAILEASYGQARNEQEAKVQQDFTEQLQKEVAKGKEAYQSMIENTKKGLTARNGNQAEQLWKKAIDDGEKVMKELDRLEKKFASDPKVQEGVVKYRQLTAEQLIETNLHLASQAMTRSSFKQAQRYCNAALALDSHSGQALSMRARIENAANEGLSDWL